MATWDGRPEDARAAVAGGLASLDGADEPYPVAELCLAGLAAEAALAAQAAARRAETARGQASPIAAGLLERARAAADGDTTKPAAPGDELGLTPREKEVLALVAEGRTNRQIADALFISDKTASVHVSSILAKLGVANRAEAAAAVHRLGLTG